MVISYNFSILNNAELWVWVSVSECVLCHIYEARHEKTCLCHMRTTKVQINLSIRAVWSAPLLFDA